VTRCSCGRCGRCRRPRPRPAPGRGSPGPVAGRRGAARLRPSDLCRADRGGHRWSPWDGWLSRCEFQTCGGTVNLSFIAMTVARWPARCRAAGTSCGRSAEERGVAGRGPGRPRRRRARRIGARRPASVDPDRRATRRSFAHWRYSGHPLGHPPDSTCVGGNHLGVTSRTTQGHRRQKLRTQKIDPIGDPPLLAAGPPRSVITAQTLSVTEMGWR
jgi:hypothetical protein